MDAIIRLDDYSYAYPEADDFVLRNIDLEIRAGECHCISGPTGSGKTTLAYALAHSGQTGVFLVLPVL